MSNLVKIFIEELLYTKYCQVLDMQINMNKSFSKKAHCFDADT